MVFIKSLLTGLLGLVVYVVFVALWTVRGFISPGEGSGGMGAVSVGLSAIVLLGGLVAFGLAFWWQWRRTREGNRRSYG
jgi:hypothetical protein